MRWRIAFLLGLLYAQNTLTMGARFHFMRSSFNSPTDKASSLTTLAPTYKSGITGFLGWGWSPYFSTSLEITYQGVGQRFYGIGRRGEHYTSEVKQHYLRLGAALQPQYAAETWGLWASIAPGVAFLTQSDMDFRGDSLQRGTLITPQIAQKVLYYLDQSTNPNDRLILLQMYRRVVPTMSLAGGVRMRLSPSVWVLGLLSFERSFGDLEKKSFRLRGEESPLYSSERKPVSYELLGIQLGLQYEVSLRP